MTSKISTIEKLHPDAIQHLMTFLNPREWYIFCLLSKSCRKIGKKFMRAREKSYLKILENINITYSLCFRPLMKLQPSGTGCSGEVVHNLCNCHRFDEPFCMKCKKNTISSLTFGPYCNSSKCRDYLWVLCDGLAVKKYSFICTNECSRKTDVMGGKCLICSRDEQVELIEQPITMKIRTRCIAKIKSGTRCRKTTTSWTGKCAIHLKNNRIFIQHNFLSSKK